MKPGFERALVKALLWLLTCEAVVAIGWAEEAAIVLRMACAAVAWAFVVRFSRVTWRHSREGRHIMGYTLVTAIFMTFATAVALLGRFLGVDLLAIALYGWLLALLWERHRLFNAGQREHRAAQPPAIPGLED